MVELKENAVDTEEQIWNKINHDTQNQTKRIKDLIALAQESRQRIDALLGRRTAARTDSLDDSITPLPTVKRHVDYDSDDRGSRRSSRDSEGGKSNRKSDRDYSYGQTDRRESRDSDRDRSDSERRDRDRSDSERHGTTKGSGRTQETSEQIIAHKKNQGLVDVGGVSISTSKLEETKVKSPGSAGTKKSLKKVESVAKVDMTPSPKAGKKPFKFGTISLQVKLD